MIDADARAGDAPRDVDRQRAAGDGARAAGRRAGRAQGQPVRARHAHDRLVEDPRHLRAAVRRHGRARARSRRRRHRRQDQLRRVRDGLVERELRLSGRCATRGRSTARPAGRAADRRRRWPRAACRSRSAPTPAARSASRRRSAASSASSRPTAASRATACSRSPRRSIRSGRSRAPSATPRWRLSVIAGADPADSTSSPEPVPDFTAALTGDVRGLRIGVPRAFVAEGVDDGVRAAFDAALETLRGAGADARRHRAAARAVRHPGLLPGVHRRGELEPRALRRRAVRLPLAAGKDDDAEGRCTAARATRASAPR